MPLRHPFHAPDHQGDRNQRVLCGSSATISASPSSTFNVRQKLRPGFRDTNVFETIFARILEEAVRHGLVDPDVLFIDATHVKANANKHKFVKLACSGTKQKVPGLAGGRDQPGPHRPWEEPARKTARASESRRKT